MPNNIKVSDMEEVTQLTKDDLVMVAQPNIDPENPEAEVESYSSKRTTVEDLANTAAKDIQFTNDLQTKSKTLTGAINEAAEVGKTSEFYSKTSFSTNSYHSWVDDGTTEEGQTIYKSQEGTYLESSGNSLCTYTVEGLDDVYFYIKQDDGHTDKAYTVLGKPNETIDLEDSSTIAASYKNTSLTDFTQYHFENLNGNQKQIQVLYHVDSAPAPTGTASIDLNNGQWVDSGETVDGHTVYKSDAGSYHIYGGSSLCTITISGVKSLTIYAKLSSNKYEQLYYGYLDTPLSEDYRNYISGDETDYTPIRYTSDGNTHTIQVKYQKNTRGYGYENDDRAYFYFVINGVNEDRGYVYVVPGEVHETYRGEVFNNYSDNHAIGQYSHAEGNNTLASGYCSHAEGNQTNATGSYSHAEGSYNTASGQYAHTEGYGTQAKNTDGAHAEGYETIADGASAHAEGKRTQAYSEGAHTEGYETYAAGTGAHAEGYQARAINAGAHAEGRYTQATYWGAHAEGKDTIASAEEAHAEGIETRATDWAAHAEGRSTQANSIYSHAEGEYTKATNTAAHAEGYGNSDSYNNASGQGSHVEGYGGIQATNDGSHAEGYGYTNSYTGTGPVVSSGQGSHAEGSKTTASGNFSHAEGLNNEATNTAAHVEGCNNHATGLYSHAEGLYNTASGQCAHVEGSPSGGGPSTASGQGSHSEGTGNTASGDYCHVEGSRSRVYSESGHAEGSGHNLYGHEAHIEGSGNSASEYSSHTEGAGNRNIAQNSHVEGGGNSNVTMSTISHTEGAGNVNYGVQSHIEGAGNKVSGEESHVEGAGNVGHGPKVHIEGGGNGGYGLGSHVEGKHNTALGYGQHAEGVYNIIGYSSVPQEFNYSTNYSEGDIVCINNMYYGNPDSETSMPFVFRCTSAPGKIQSGNGVTIIHPSEWNSSSTYTTGDVVKVSGYGFYRANSSSVTSNPVLKHNNNGGGSDWIKIKEVLSPFRNTSSSGYYLLDCNDISGANDIAIVASDVTVQAMWEPVSTSMVGHVEGLKNISTGSYQHVQGKYNDPDPDQAFIIGNGTYADGVTTRSNALTVDWSGNMVLAGDITPGTQLTTSAPTLAAAINELAAKIPAPPTTDGTYTLSVTVSSGVPTYSWV